MNSFINLMEVKVLWVPSTEFWATVIGKTSKTIVLPSFTEKNTAAATQWWCRGLVYHKFMVAALLIFRVFTCPIFKYFIQLVYNKDILIILITTHMAILKRRQPSFGTIFC